MPSFLWTAALWAAACAAAGDNTDSGTTSSDAALFCFFGFVDRLVELDGRWRKRRRWRGSRRRGRHGDCDAFQRERALSVEGAARREGDWCRDHRCPMVGDRSVRRVYRQYRPLYGANDCPHAGEGDRQRVEHRRIRQKNGASELTISTALLGAQTTVSATPYANVSIYQHQIAASGSRVYAIWNAVDANTLSSVNVQSSDDGSAAWNAAVPVNDSDGVTSLDCTGIVVDPGNPMTVYATYRFGGGTAAASTKDIYDQRERLGHARFRCQHRRRQDWKNTVIASENGGTGVCADIASPLAGHVIIEDPIASNTSFIDLWESANKGADFNTTPDGNGQFFASGHLASLARRLQRAILCTFLARPKRGYDRRHRIAAPLHRRLGHSLHCLSRELPDRDCAARGASMLERSRDYVLGSDVVRREQAGRPGSSPDGRVPRQWKRHARLVERTIGEQRRPPRAELRWSEDIRSGADSYRVHDRRPGGRRPGPIPDVIYDGATLWIAYYVGDGVMSDRMVIDKSCDNAITWSGPMLVNGVDPSPLGAAAFPELFIASQKVHIATDSSANKGKIAVMSLVP